MKRTGPIPQIVRFYQALQRYRFATLLASLILLFVAIAIVHLVRDSQQEIRDPQQQVRNSQQQILTGLSIAILFDLMLLSAVNAVCQTRKTMIVAIAVAVPTALFSVASILARSPAFHVISNLLTVAFVALVIILVLDFLFRSRRVDANMICASLCIYLLMGIVWASLYSLCETFQPGSFLYAYVDETEQVGVDEIEQVRMEFGGETSLTPIYYSFVTLTTLGYGDMVPVSSPARILAILEAVLGQIYLTVLVARLVGLHIAQATSPSSDDP